MGAAHRRSARRPATTARLPTERIDDRTLGRRADTPPAHPSPTARDEPGRTPTRKAERPPNGGRPVLHALMGWTGPVEPHRPSTRMRLARVHTTGLSASLLETGSLGPAPPTGRADDSTHSDANPFIHLRSHRPPLIACHGTRPDTCRRRALPPQPARWPPPAQSPPAPPAPRISAAQAPARPGPVHHQSQPPTHHPYPGFRRLAHDPGELQLQPLLVLADQRPELRVDCPGTERRPRVHPTGHRGITTCHLLAQPHGSVSAGVDSL